MRIEQRYGMRTFGWGRSAANRLVNVREGVMTLCSVFMCDRRWEHRAKHHESLGKGVYHGDFLLLLETSGKCQRHLSLEAGYGRPWTASDSSEKRRAEDDERAICQRLTA